MVMRDLALIKVRADASALAELNQLANIFRANIVDVAHGMRKVTIAEFVEDAETLTMLRDFGVDLVQGYHLDMPRAQHPALASAAPDT